MKFCYNCGKQIEDSASFCSACGAKQHASPAQNPNITNYVNKNTNAGNNIQGSFVPVIVMWAVAIFLIIGFAVVCQNTEQTKDTFHIPFVSFCLSSFIVSIVCFRKAKKIHSENHTNLSQVIYAISIIVLIAATATTIGGILEFSELHGISPGNVMFVLMLIGLIVFLKMKNSKKE